MVGFALETNDEDKNARSKMEKNNFDFIILNRSTKKDRLWPDTNK
jgi:phosphopantothenoylcysteine decarboxylase/phosphopantothenate--cysteine ligase